MARERAFTDKQIITAAAELQADGKPVNGNSLRNRVGVGRPDVLLAVYHDLCAKGTVIVPVVDKPAETEKHYDLDPVVAGMRDVLLGDLDAMIQSINNAANTTAENKLRAAVVEATELKVHAEQQVSDAMDRETAAYNESEDLRELVTVRDETISEKDDLIAALRGQISELHTSLEVSQAQTAAQAEIVIERDKRIKSIDAKHDKAVAAKDAALSAKSEAVGEVRALTKQIKSQEGEITELKTVAKNHQLEKELLSNEISALSARSEVMTATVVEAQDANRKMVDELFTANRDLIEIKAQVKALTPPPPEKVNQDK